MPFLAWWAAVVVWLEAGSLAAAAGTWLEGSVLEVDAGGGVSTRDATARQRQGEASGLMRTEPQQGRGRGPARSSWALPDLGPAGWQGRHNATSPLLNATQIFNVTADALLNTTKAAINVTVPADIDDQSEVLKAMQVTLNGKGDTLALASSVCFSAASCLLCFVVFGILRRRYPALYQHHGPEGHTVATLSEQEVIDAAGLDAWMFLFFQSFAMRLIAYLGLMALCLCPMHWQVSDPQNPEWVTRLTLSVAEDRVTVLWVHAGAAWFVVIVSTQALYAAQAKFVEHRFAWLRALRAPRATTLLVEGIPEAYRTDESLKAYFTNLFSEQAVIRAYVVRKTEALQAKLLRLADAQRAVAESTSSSSSASASASASASSRAAGTPSSSSIAGRAARLANAGTREQDEKSRQQAVDLGELEVATERARLARAAKDFDPDACACSGFVTFRTRLAARRALREQLRADAAEFVVQHAPEPSDVAYHHLQMGRPASSERFGWLTISALFVAWVPLVLTVAGLLSLASLERALPSLEAWRTHSPELNAMLEGVCATMALSLLMGMLPSIFLAIIERFFRPPSGALAQVFLERLYFIFQLVFVLLVTVLGQGIISTLVFLADHPIGLLPLLARTLPLASHFYQAYMVLGWLTSTFELLRLGPLAKYLGLKAFLGPEAACLRAEEDAIYTGQRYGKSAMMLVIVLVFSTLSPLVLVFGLIYFAVSRVVYGYVCCFAEPRRADSGGEFWVSALKQVHVGLFVYVLMMLGIMSAHAVGPFLCLLPTLPYLTVAWVRFDTQFVWECLPLEHLAGVDEAAEAVGEKADSNAYTQPECALVGARMSEATSRRLSDAAASLRQAAAPEEEG